MSKNLPDVLKAAHAHQGAAFIEIFQNCIVYNKDVFDDFAAPKGADEHQLWLEDGEPMLFGTRAAAQGHALDRETAALEGGRRASMATGRRPACIVHDVKNRSLAHMLVELPFGEFPMALGVIYDDPRPTYEAAVARREAPCAARARTPTSAALLGQGPDLDRQRNGADPV